MSFGFGVGNIIRLTEEAWKLYKGYKDSSEHFAQLAAELQSLYVVLAEISDTLHENDNGSGKDSEAGGGCGLEVSRCHRLEKLQDGCRDLLRDLQAIYDKYESLGTQQQRAWDRVRFGLKDLSDLRARLVSSTTMLTAWKVAVINLSAKVFHIPFIALTPSLKLHSIVQRSPSPGNSAPEGHPSVQHYTTFEPLVADPDVHVVVLCTPPNTHYPFARAALEAGKHVLVEKPFVPTAAEADALASLAREKGRVLCVYQNRRWDSDFLTVRRLMDEGTLGRVIEFETHFDRLRPTAPTGTWKASMGMAQGGGALYDLGTHLLDQVFVLFGMPSSVYGKFVRQREGRLVKGSEGEADEPDSVTVVLSYADTGLMVQVRIGVVNVETRQMRFQVRGSKGSYHKTGLDPQEDQLCAGGKATDAGFGREEEDKYGFVCLLGEDGTVERKVCPTVEPETYVKFYELFAKAVQSGKEEDVPVPATQAAQVLRIIEAVRESPKTGREVSL